MIASEMVLLVVGLSAPLIYRWGVTNVYSVQCCDVRWGTMHAKCGFLKPPLNQGPECECEAC